MSFGKAKIIAVVALTISLLCPIVELFDCWDHTEQTGNDTEYTLVIVGLCIGTVYAVARFLLSTDFGQHKLSRPLDTSVVQRAQSAFASMWLPEIPSSPPSLGLRI